MEKRKLGRSGLEIAPLVLGGNVFGWTADQATSFRILDAFLDAGFDAVDTADVYSHWVPGHKGGESESVIGAWLKQGGRRDRVVLATKLGMELEGKKGLSKAYMVEAVEASLKRLQTDCIDLYQAHRDDSDTPLDETLEAFADLIEAGKVRAIGASNYTAERLKAALDVSAARDLPRYESLQPLYNLYDRADFEQGLETVCLDNDVGVICYFGLASGFLTGKYRSEADFSKSPRGQQMGRYLDERGRKVLKALDEVSEAHGATQAQVSLAWLMARPAVTAPIASATSVEQLQDIAKAAALKLTADEIGKLDGASEGGEPNPGFR